MTVNVNRSQENQLGQRFLEWCRPIHNFSGERLESDTETAHELMTEQAGFHREVERRLSSRAGIIRIE
jgi:hypothetical protein